MGNCSGVSIFDQFCFHGIRCLFQNQLWKLMLKHFFFSWFFLHHMMVKLCRSPFLRLYLSEIETQFKGNFSMTRFCICFFFSLVMCFHILDTWETILPFTNQKFAFILLCRCCNCSKDTEEHKDCEYTQSITPTFSFFHRFCLVHTEKSGHPL